MRKNPYYILSTIGDEFYLVPFGQAIEDHARTVCISEVAAFIWDEMDANQDVEALAGRLAEEYEVMLEEVGSLEGDVKALLKDLEKEGIVYNNKDATRTVAGFFLSRRRKRVDNNEEKRAALCDIERRLFHTVRIAGITIRLFGGEKYFSDSFKPFSVDADRCDFAGGEEGRLNEGAANFDGHIGAEAHESIEENEINVYVIEDNPSKAGYLPTVLCGMAVELYDGGDYYVMRSIDMPEMKEGHFRKDGSKAVLYMNPDAELPDFVKRYRYDQMEDERFKRRWKSPEDVQVDYAGSVFHAIRHAFLLRAQLLDMYVIHSASILYNGQAWLFSALSGTGKSTHTNLWHKLYGTPFLDGDLNLLAFEDGKPVVKGIPWCGTSGIFTTETYPLGGIILLARDKTNHVEELSYQNQVLGIQMRFISPKWNAKQTLESLDFAERIAKSARIARLYCNMEDEAAEVCRAWIDNGKSKIF